MAAAELNNVEGVIKAPPKNGRWLVQIETENVAIRAGNLMPLDDPEVWQRAFQRNVIGNVRSIAAKVICSFSY